MTQRGVVYTIAGGALILEIRFVQEEQEGFDRVQPAIFRALIVPLEHSCEEGAAQGVYCFAAFCLIS